MDKIGLYDLKILALGIQNNGNIDAKRLEILQDAGTGRLLDCLASLVERKLLSLNQDRSFQVTATARQILWKGSDPLRIRILRVLDIGSMTGVEIATYLNENHDDVMFTVETLRKDHLILMTTVRKHDVIQQVFEILPRGADQLNPKYCSTDSDTNGRDIHHLISDVTYKIKNSDMEAPLKEEIIKLLYEIRARLLV